MPEGISERQGAVAGEISLAALSLGGDGTARQAAGPQAGDYVFVPSASAAVDCDDCDDHHATHHCLECNLNLCGKCCDDHHRRKSTKQHTVAPLDSSSPKSAQTPTTVQRPDRAALRGGGASGPAAAFAFAPCAIATGAPGLLASSRQWGSNGSVGLPPCAEDAPRRKTKQDKVLAELAFSNPGVKAAVAAVPQSPASSSAGSASSPLTRAAAARSLPFRDNDNTESGGDTESDSDAGDGSTVVYTVGIPREARPLEKGEDVLVREMLEELPDSFVRRCNHDVEHQITCMFRKYKTAYAGNGQWKQFDVNEMPEIIAGGVTQNGKTMIKAVGIWAAWRLGAGHADATKIATILLSTGLQGTSSLCSKLTRAFNHFPPNLRPPIVFAGSAPFSNLEHRDNLRNCVAEGGCIVVNDTAARVQHAISAVSEARGWAQGKWPQVQIFMDEADAFYRNAPGSYIKLEHAVQGLLARIRPILRMSVSATLIPVFLHLKEKQHGVDVNSIIYTCPGKDYNGVQDFRALVDENGDNVFLNPGDLTKTNGYFNDKVAALYHTALATQKSLVLNITNPGVSTFNNVHDHAIQIQQAYDHVGCIVFVGKGIYYYPPKRERRDVEEFLKKEWTIGGVIQHVDDTDGLETPLVVIGYSQMFRGDSFRSDCRVPTHICCALGTAMSIEKMVQAMGRATYGDSKLEENGFTHVTVLTFANDYDTAKAYPVWLQEMNDKIKDGMTIQEALSPDALYTDQANLTLGQNRSIGQKRDHLFLETSFEEPKAGQEREGSVWRQQEILKDPMNKLVYDVASQHYQESLANFIEQMRAGEQSLDYGGTSEEFLDAINGIDGVSDAARDIRKVRAALQTLVRMGALKSSSQFGPVPRGAKARYFVPDDEVL